MDNFLSGVTFCCQKGPFLAETTVQSRSFPVLEISDTIVHFNKTQKKIFVNNFCVPELNP